MPYDALPVPVVGFAAWSGTGKTTLLTHVVPALKRRGLRVGVIKHAHHRFDIDHPGKDSYRLRKAGAEQTLVASANRLGLIVERQPDSDPTLTELLTWLNPATLDIILVEGFRHLAIPKIELHRLELGKPLLSPSDQDIVAIASNAPIDTDRPILDLNDFEQIAEFIVRTFVRSTEHLDLEGS